jgi:hypothetical protein
MSSCAPSVPVINGTVPPTPLPSTHARLTRPEVVERAWPRGQQARGVLGAGPAGDKYEEAGGGRGDAAACLALFIEYWYNSMTLSY